MYCELDWILETWQCLVQAFCRPWSPWDQQAWNPWIENVGWKLDWVCKFRWLWTKEVRSGANHDGIFVWVFVLMIVNIIHWAKPAEEEEVGPSANHDGNGKAVLRPRDAEQAERNCHLRDGFKISLLFEIASKYLFCFKMDFFTNIRKHAIRKRTLLGQRTMFSLKIWPPRKPLSLNWTRLILLLENPFKDLINQINDGNTFKDLINKIINTRLMMKILSRIRLYLIAIPR